MTTTVTFSADMETLLILQKIPHGERSRVINTAIKAYCRGQDIEKKLFVLEFTKLQDKAKRLGYFIELKKIKRDANAVGI